VDTIVRFAASSGKDGPDRTLTHYKEYQHEQTTQDRLVYRDEEESAKARRVGLWKDAEPVPPWEWRKGDRVKP
jgi:endonuclease YncB( thermonuclease family)